MRKEIRGENITPFLGTLEKDRTMLKTAVYKKEALISAIQFS
jgi:hypothetical protein